MPLLTYAEAAAKMNVKERAVRQMVYDKSLPVVRLSRSNVRISDEAIEKWIRACTVEARKAAK